MPAIHAKSLLHPDRQIDRPTDRPTDRRTEWFNEKLCYRKQKIFDDPEKSEA